jgi:hypothetical protein
MKSIIFIFSILISLGTYAQSEPPSLNLKNIDGRPIMVAGLNIDLEGSVFLADKYYKATLILKNKQFIKDLPIKIDLLDSKIFFLNEQQQEMESIMPVGTIVFNDKSCPFDQFIFTNGFLPKPNVYMQVLDTGKVWLLKQHQIRTEEYKEYGTPITKKKAYVVYDYFITNQNGILEKITQKEELMNAMKSKKEALIKFIKEENLKLKSDEDYKKIIRFYRS